MSKKYILGDVRRSQVLTGSGPGAIIDFRVENTPVSVIAAGLEEWPDFYGRGNADVQKVYESRLQNILQVDHFRLPPIDARPSYMVPDNDSGPQLVGVRFPKWLQCTSCHVIKDESIWSSDEGWMKFCSTCTKGKHKAFVVPVRFMCACENGHIQDFPWTGWAQHTEKCTDRFKLTLKSDGKSSGLSGMKLKCSTCFKETELQSAFDKDSFSKKFKCNGNIPWLSKKSVECKAPLRTVQRGASNLYFPVIKSAIDIPPWSDGFVRAFGSNWNIAIKKETKKEIENLISALEMDKKLKMSAEDIADKIWSLRGTVSRSSQEEILKEEYQQFINKSLTLANNENFQIKDETVPPELTPWISKVVGVKRLREVRVLTGFTRIFPTGDEQAEQDERIAPIANEQLDWLPAIEVKGEGVFIEMKQEKIVKWEAHFAERAKALQDRYNKEIEERSGGKIKKGKMVISGRFLLLHSISHALMKQMSLKCGYSSSSLRERLYCDDKMAGILIYTASSDSDGTLGGLVRQSYADNFYPLFVKSVKDMLWCSSDPLCLNSSHTIANSLNNSACHSCLFLSETSCVHFNRFLDRATIAGIAGKSESGFFKGLFKD